MHRLHSAEVCRLWLVFFSGRLLDADNPQDWTTGAQLNVRSNSHFGRRCDALAIYEGTESRIRVCYRAVTIGQAELGVLTRNHGPLFLGKEVMAHGRIATNKNGFAGERAFTMQLAAAI